MTSSVKGEINQAQDVCLLQMIDETKWLGSFYFSK